nr:LysR family transcriptional regulator [Streptomyces sp. SID3343]
MTLLRTFLAVHRAGSFTRASASLGISQPAITAQIRALEKQVGKQLFERLPRGVAPTGPADELARRLAPHLDAIAAITAREIHGDDPLHRTVHFAGPTDLTSLRVLPSLGDLIRRGLRLRVTLGPGDELLSGLASARHDIVVSDVRPRMRGISAMPFADEEYVLVGAPVWAERFPAGRIRAEGPRALVGAPMVGEAEEQPLAQRYWAGVFDAKPAIPAALVVPDLRAVLECVRAGTGIAVLPRYLCADALERRAVVDLLDPELPPLHTVFLAIREGTLSQPHIAHLHGELLARAARWS